MPHIPNHLTPSQGNFWACWHAALCQVNALRTATPLTSQDLFNEFVLAKKSSTLEQDLWAQNFFTQALEICQKEAQNFLTEEQIKDLTNQWQDLEHQLPTTSGLRFSIGLACTFLSWCQDTQFFEKSEKEYPEQFDENPLNFFNQEPNLWKNILGY